MHEVTEFIRQCRTSYWNRINNQHVYFSKAILWRFFFFFFCQNDGISLLVSPFLLLVFDFWSASEIILLPVLPIARMGDLAY